LMAHSRPDPAAASDPTVPAASPASDKLRCEGDRLQLADLRLMRSRLADVVINVCN